MNIDVKDLPLHMQKQVLRKLAEEEKARQGNRRANRDKAKAKRGVEMPRDLMGDGNVDQSGEMASKYHARKVTLTLNDGTEHTFDSRHEAQVYSELALLEQAGEISDLRIQVPYELIPSQRAPSGKAYRNCKYIADFVYRDSAGNIVVSDAKGVKTKEYTIKKKLMLQVYGIEIKEV